MIVKLVKAKKFTIFPIRETETKTEEDMHRAPSQQLSFCGFTSLDQCKAWGLDIGIEHKGVLEEVDLEPCAADRVVVMNDMDRKTLG
jgi:hypothetical protein